MALEQSALRYMLREDVRQYGLREDGLYDLRAFVPDPDARPDTILHDQVRPPAQMVSALAVGLALSGVFDAAVIGVSRREATRVLVRLVRTLASEHVANVGAAGEEALWGDNWQSAHWAFFAAFGAFLSWDTLDADTQEAIARVVVHEADRFDADPPYANTSRIDTKAEENAWNANILVLAQAMMPNHPNAPRWRYRASQWMLGSYTRASDVRRHLVVDGLPVAGWVGGYNIGDDGFVYNHGLVHPDYIASSEMALWNYLPIALARQRPPEAIAWNVDVAYWCLQSCVWPSPPYASPGGTMYQPGEALVYYPDGTDWSPNRVDNFLIVDVLIDAFHPATPGAALPAASLPWALARANHLRAMQARSSTGQLFIEADGLDFPPKESFAAVHFAYALLGRWLGRAGAVQEPRNWRTCVADDDCDAPRACDQSVCNAESGVCEMRAVAMCESRWSAPESLTGVDFGVDAGSPSATDDGLELYFRREVDGVGTVWVTRRPSREQAWGAPRLIPEVSPGAINGAGDVRDPFVSADGLTLLFVSDRDTGQPGLAQDNVWQATRAGTWRSWDPPALVTELSSLGRERQPQLTREARSVVFVSDRSGNDELYLAERAEVDAAWVLREGLLSQLRQPGRDWSPVLADDRRTLYFCSDRDDPASPLDVYVSERASEDQLFGEPRRVPSLSSPAEESDLWMSWDDHAIMFARSGGVEMRQLLRASR